MSRWRGVVRRELARYGEQTGYDVVNLDELYDELVPVLREEFPDNDHPEAKLRQVLQQLRDRDEVTFLDRGTYRIQGLSTERAPALDDGQEPEYTAAEYETTVGARSVPAAFRAAVLTRYDHVCPVSGVDHDRLLDVAHLLPWSDYPDHRTDPGNVLPLSRTHHAAFDAELFTLDDEFTLHVSPSFETDADVLRRTLLEQSGTRLDGLRESPLSTEYLSRHNDSLEWW